MKILQIVSGFAPAWGLGGAVRLTYDLSIELAKKGHEVVVYTTDKATLNQRLNPNTIEKIDGIEVTYFRNISNKYATLYNIPNSPKLIFTMMNEISDFDIVHIHEYRTINGHFAAKIALFKNIPFIIQPHGSISVDVGNVPFKITYDVLFGLKLLSKADSLLALSDQERSIFQSLGLDDSKISIIPNGIDMNPIHFKHRSFRKAYNIDEEAIVVLFLGRLHKIKGLDLLIPAFKRVCDAKKDRKMILILAGQGDNNYVIELKRLVKSLQIENNVIFTGPLYDEIKDSCFFESDIFVLPSYYDAFPIAVLEAAAHNLPLLISSKCGIPEVKSGDFGIIIEPDIDSIFGGIIQLVDNPTLRMQIADSANKVVNKVYSIRKTGNAIEQLYKSVQRKRADQ